MPSRAKTAIVEYIVFTGEQSHERESSGELLGPSVLADGAGRAKKLYPGRGKAGDQQVGYQPENQRAGAGDWQNPGPSHYPQ
ncbi:hypothetical protein WAJ05_19440, partial [Acinetobacter baumannii]